MTNGTLFIRHTAKLGERDDIKRVRKREVWPACVHSPPLKYARQMPVHHKNYVSARCLGLKALS